MATNVSGIHYDAPKTRWSIRWVDDEGKRRSCTRFKSRDEAEEFRRTLVAAPPTPQTDLAESFTGDAPDQAAYADVGEYLLATTAWLAAENTAAVVARDDSHLDRIAKAARTNKTNAEARIALDDRRKLKRVLAELLDLREKQLRAATDGTRLDTSGDGGGTAQRTVRREDAVH
jgi:DNA-binding beta-propeller fold protein YncE